MPPALQIREATQRKYATTVFAGSFIKTRMGSGVERIAMMTMLNNNTKPKMFQPSMNAREIFFLKAK